MLNRNRVCIKARSSFLLSSSLGQIWIYENPKRRKTVNPPHPSPTFRMAGSACRHLTFSNYRAMALLECGDFSLLSPSNYFLTKSRHRR
ncbi:MAG: hypothetical protein M2R45_01171 [Verrucomicrobia subdivision 3 bacterium]|nr:hypothetical protein [Limisphaerales bacterium]MCS1415276.1 hypothetical protein [Limisphaerales bacterium]